MAKWTRRTILALLASLGACQTQSKRQLYGELNKTLKIAMMQAKAVGGLGERSPLYLTLNKLSEFCEGARGDVRYGEERIYGHGLIQARVTIEVPDKSLPWMAG